MEHEVKELLREVIDLLDRTRDTFRSKQIEHARKLLVEALAIPSHTCVYLPEALLEQIAARERGVETNEARTTVRSMLVQSDLERYYGLVERELPGLREVFTPTELTAVADSMNGWASRTEPAALLLGELHAGAETFTVLAAQVQDSIRLDHLAERHQIDGAALVEALRHLSRSQTIALIDAVERWWNRTEPRGAIL